MIKIEANIDNMNPEIYSTLLDLLLEAGANDAWLNPIIMKKGRPGIEVNILCEDDLLDTISQLLFTHTTTIGFRYCEYKRNICERKFTTYYYEGLPFHVKEAFYNGKRINVSLEFEDLRKISQIKNISIKELERKIWKIID